MILLKSLPTTSRGSNRSKARTDKMTRLAAVKITADHLGINAQLGSVHTRLVTLNKQRATYSGIILARQWLLN